jgi:hypothetical protein
MGILKKLFKKKKSNNEEGKEEFRKTILTEEQIQELENQYKNNPHFIGICRYDNCYSPIYKSDKYNTIANNDGKKIKIHTRCLRKMRKEAKKLINSGVQIK